jgi:hypothetical protein
VAHLSPELVISPDQTTHDSLVIAKQEKGLAARRRNGPMQISTVQMLTHVVEFFSPFFCQVELMELRGRGKS